MIIANFEGNESVKYVSGLYQYDKEQVLQITGLNLPRVVEIDFSLEETGVTSKSCPAITKDGITEVMIPNEMLVNQDTDMNYNIYAFVYVTDASTSETVKRIVMQVRARTKPEQFEALGNRELFEKAINEVNNSADRAETAANTSEQNAKKTAEDRKTIEEMVETVSGIEQQVQDVKKYAGQAETAASNAALSERESKKSEDAALRAKADAETAKGNAETAARETASDRTTVERAKEEVLQAKQQVSTDREAVEAVERKVAQMGNTIPQAVLEGVQAVKSAGVAEKQGIVQAGTEQKSAVESAGTKAVENINLAKKSATDAVETAKTGAVGAVGTAGAEQTQNVTAEGEKQVKAVADKGNEVLQSIPGDFTVQMESKLDKQQGVENAGKAMVINPEGVIVPGEVTGGDGIPIINTASGESPLVVPDSAERVNKGFGLGGNTKQATTTGAQLFDLSKSTIGTAIDKTNGLEVTYEKSWRSSDYIAIKGNTRYSVNAIENNLNTGFAFYREDRTFISGIACQKSFQTPQDAKYVRLTVFNADNISETFMLNEGETAKPYEPYTDGKPSPSPEYPQEIKNVGKRNEEKQKYEVDVRVTGKNLLNQELLKDESNFDKTINPQGYWQYFIYLNPNTKYTVSRKNKDGYQTGKSIKLTTTKNTTAGQWLMATHSASENKQSMTLTTPDTGLISINFLAKDINDVNEALKIAGYLQIECGEMASNFESYKEQTLTLTSDRPITKWDKLVERDGQIGWLYKGKISDIPKRGYRSLNGMSNNYYFNIENAFYDAVDSSSSPAIDSQYFTHFKLGNPYSEKGNLAWLYKVGQSSNLRIGVKNESIVTAEEFEKYISDKDMKILYELATPEFVPLQQSEQDAIRALMTYYPTTVITTDGGEAAPNVELTYTADTKNFILNREKAMQAQMLNIQSALISSKISGGGIKVTDSSPLPIEEFAMSGKLEQMQTTGAQLFDVSKISATNVTVDKDIIIVKEYASNTGITAEQFLEMTGLKPGDKFSISYTFEGTITGSTGGATFTGSSKGLNVMGGGLSGNLKNTVSLPSDFGSAYGTLYFYGNKSGANCYIKNLMINKGESVKPYEPYTGGNPSPSPENPQPIETTPQGIITVDFTDGTKHQTVELNCPREFTKWDRLEKINGVWNWIFQSNKKIVNEKTGFDINTSQQQERDGIVFTTSFSDASGGNQTSLCDKFKNLNYVYGSSYKEKYGHYCDHVSVEQKYFRPPNESIQTLEQWKTWLTENPIEILYKTKEPELIPLSMSEQDKLNALTMYAPNTEITNTGGCNMELTYTVDTKSYVDSKILTLSKALL